MQTSHDLSVSRLLPQTVDLPWKYKLAYLVYQFSKAPEQVECPVTHSFTPGQYIREMRIPAGTLFIGRPHINGHEVELVSGTVVNHSEDGDCEIKAPYSFRSIPGYQAVFHAVTDVVGRTIHENPLELRDVQVLEDRDFESLQALLTRGEMIEQKVGELCLA
jgi:hypothetical protein